MANPARVSALLDEAPLSFYRIVAIFLCILVTIIDGLDFVAIGVVAPLMQEDIALSPTQLGYVLAATQIGAAIGAIALGKAADHYGRKRLIVISLLMISVFTFLTAIADSYETLLPIRFFVGVALTGALPATLALTSELAPERYRATVISLVVAGFPMGAAIGSIGGGAIAQHAGWQAIFYLGAALPLLLAVIIYYVLPESPRFLSLTDNRGDKIGVTLKRLVRTIDPDRLWEPIPKSLVPVSDRDVSRSSATFSSLFEKGLATPTLMLWGMLFCSGILSNVTLVWLPTIFTNAGLTIGYAVMVVGSINIGATLGMALAGRILDTVGPRITIGVAYIVAALATASLGYIETANISVIVGGVMGFFLGITTSAGYALSAIIYPTSVRSTGVGASAAALRVGTIIAPLIIPVLLSFALPMKWTFVWVAVVPAIAAMIAAKYRKSSQSA